MSTLPPGNYFIEMAFRRPVTEETLEAALKAMGFTSVEFDKNEDVVVGALSLNARPQVKPIAAPTMVVTKVALPSSTTNRLSTTATTAPAMVPVAKPSPQLATFKAVALPSYVQPSLTLASPTPFKAVALPSYVQPSLVPAQAVPYKPSYGNAVGSPTPTSPGLSLRGPALPLPSSFSSVVAAPSPSSPFSSMTITPFTPSAPSTSAPGSVVTYPAGDPAGSSSPLNRDAASLAASAQAAANSALSAASNAANNFDSGGGGGGGGGGGDGGGGGGGSGSDAAPAVASDVAAMTVIPETQLLSRLSPELSRVMSVAVPDRWRRWVEWGSPFAAEPGQLINISGEGEDVTYFRFIGTLSRALAVTNLPDMSWMFIRRLSLDPFANLTFQVRPFQLKRNSYYEFRFFSRLKSNPTKDSVKETMATMGFSPMKLSLLKKNMRIPFRPRVSVGMWLGIGRWTAASSIVTTEDPFFFESMKEVSP